VIAGVVSYMLLCSLFLIESTSPYSLNTQRGWHTAEDGTLQKYRK